METFFLFQFPFLIFAKKTGVKKETILNQAKEMFLKHGVKTIGMDDIAQSLHISKKTIYQHFTSKEELIKQTIDYFYEIVYGKINEIVGKCKSPIHEHFEIRKTIDTTIGLKLETSSFIFQLRKYYPELAHLLNQKHYCDYQKIIKQNLEIGIDKGLYRENIDINFVCSQFFSGSKAFETDAIFVENFMENFSQTEFDRNFLEHHLRAISTSKGIKILEKLLKKYE